MGRDLVRYSYAIQIVVRKIRGCGATGRRLREYEEHTNHDQILSFAVFAAALIAVSGAALVTASFDAEARRAGGGSSVGRQSSNVTQQRQATTPPAAGSNTAGATAAPAAAGAATAGAATAGAAAKSGASRWLGPIAGIAAGLGIAALLSSMGLSGAFAEFLSSALLIALAVFAVLFIVRRLRGAAPRPATQSAFGGAGQAPASRSNSPCGVRRCSRLRRLRRLPPRLWRLLLPRPPRRAAQGW